MTQTETTHGTLSEATTRSVGVQRRVMRDAETGILMPLRMDFACLNDFAFTPDVDFEEMQAALVGAGSELDRLRRNANEASGELIRLADELKQCSTIGGEWDGTEEEAKEEYERLMTLAERLSA